MARTIKINPACETCKGKGRCQTCDGEGQVSVELYSPPHALEQNIELQECPDCNGSAECSDCELDWSEPDEVPEA